MSSEVYEVYHLCSQEQWLLRRRAGGAQLLFKNYVLYVLHVHSYKFDCRFADYTLKNLVLVLHGMNLHGAGKLYDWEIMQQVLYPYNKNVSLTMNTSAELSVGIFDNTPDTYGALLALSPPTLHASDPPPLVSIKAGIWNYADGDEAATNLSIRKTLLKILGQQIFILGDENYPYIQLFSYIRHFMSLFGTCNA